MKNKTINGIFSLLLVFIVVAGCFGVTALLLNEKETESPPNTNAQITWVSYGDSLTEGGHWQAPIKDYFGFNHINLGSSGAPMALISGRENAMTNTPRMQAILNANPDVITIWAGANDVGPGILSDTSELTKTLHQKNKTTFIGGYSYLIETLKEWKPTLKIIIVVQYYWNDDWPNEQWAIDRMTLMREQTFALCDYYNLPYVDGEDLEVDGRLHISNTTYEQTLKTLLISEFKTLGYKQKS